MHPIAVWTFLVLLAIPMSNCRRFKAPGDNEAAVVDSRLKGFSDGPQLIDLRRRIHANFNNSPSKEKLDSTQDPEEKECTILSNAVYKTKDLTDLKERETICQRVEIGCSCDDFVNCNKCQLENKGIKK